MFELKEWQKGGACARCPCGGVVKVFGRWVLVDLEDGATPCEVCAVSGIPMIADLLDDSERGSGKGTATEGDLGKEDARRWKTCPHCFVPVEQLLLDGSRIVCEWCPDLTLEQPVDMLRAGEARWPSLSKEELHAHVDSFLDEIAALRMAARSCEEAVVRKMFVDVVREMHEFDEGARAHLRDRQKGR